MALGAGTLYVNAVMGQAPSARERDHVRKSSLQITARHDIDVEETEQPSRPDSWSMHYDRTDQAPYLPGRRDDNMNTETSLRRLPKHNESRDLAFFLRTTGPTAPHRRPSKMELHPRRMAATPKNALRFLKFGQKSNSKCATTHHEESTQAMSLDDVDTRRCTPDDVKWHDEGGLLSGTSFVQGVSSAGQRYLAIVPKVDEKLHEKEANETFSQPLREPSPAVMDSEVSISYADSMNSPEVYDTWMCATAHEDLPRGLSPARESSAHLPLPEEHTLRVVNPSSPASFQRYASDPPTPEPLSAVSAAESNQSFVTQYPTARPVYSARALTSHPVHSTTISLPLPKVALPHEEFPVRHLRAGKDLDIQHPSPRRFASHPVLLQRVSSISSSLYPRSTSDSPGPPPRSPLRLRRDQRTIDAIASHAERDATPRPVLNCSEIGDYRTDILPVKPTVTTMCTGPIKRPPSGDKSASIHPAHPISRKEREERSKARKLRDKPPPSRAIDTLVNTSPRASRQRLKKARPQISIPDLRPAPLNTRSSSTASSNTSWKKITEFTRTPVSAVPSETTPISATGYTPTSPSASNVSAANEARMTLSPVMLVAEEIPVPTKSQQKPARLIMKEGKSYSPRPRSASLPRSAMKRRSISRSRPSTRASSPAPEPQDDEAPPLPSPPPNRKLPPTPPASGSERPRKSKLAGNVDSSKELPPTPRCAVPIPGQIQASGGAERAKTSSNTQHPGGSGADPRKSPDFDARLAALEHQNKLLSAALVAVLRTNGQGNATLSELTLLDGPKSPAAWETRMARRKVSDAASSSNGSALEMYMSTRRGSRHGF